MPSQSDILRCPLELVRRIAEDGRRSRPSVGQNQRSRSLRSQIDITLCSAVGELDGVSPRPIGWCGKLQPKDLRTVFAGLQLEGWIVRLGADHRAFGQNFATHRERAGSNKIELALAVSKGTRRWTLLRTPAGYSPMPPKRWDTTTFLLPIMYSASTSPAGRTGVTAIRQAT